MRFTPSIFDGAKSRNFIGNNANHGRVTVDPYWQLKTTPPVYGSSYRGPFRYYTDGAPIEYEVPSIKTISWNRSNTQDLASCNISMYNTWHNLNEEEQELAGQLGKPGYFWPKRGQGDSAITWEQSPGKGAYTKDGVWDANFSWENVLVEDVIIRTYEGRGGKPTPGNFKSIQDNIDDDELLITGVWIVNSVTAGSDGTLTLNCTDIGRILIDQMVFPPVIPGTVYPLEYYPPGRSAFDSPWGPKLKRSEIYIPESSGIIDNISPAKKGEVWIRGFNSSADADTTVNSIHPISHAVDGDWDTYAMSEAYETMTGGKPYFEFLPGSDPEFGSGINSLKVKTWGGGYTVYISIAEDPDPDNPSSTSVWKGAENIPGGGIKYVKKAVIPLYLPDGMEEPMDIDLSDVVWVDDDGDEIDDPFERFSPNTYYAHKVRLTFENLQYSHIPDGTARYRCGIRDLVFFRDGANLNGYSPDFAALPWTFALEQHPTRGYWVIDTVGRVHGFGDASDYDWNRFGDVPIQSYEPNNRAVGIAAHPSGEGYWVVDWIGRVWAYGAAAEGATAVPTTSRYNFGEYKIPDPYVGQNQQGKVGVRGIAATHTGDGYWVIYSNGVIRGFGDAAPNYATIPANDVATFMDWFLEENYTTGRYVPYSIGLKATAIASHPKKMGFWVTDGSGQVWAFGDVTTKGQLKNRTYLSSKIAGTFKLQNLEWATSIESTPSGDGYWIGFGSGRVASFGDAKKLGKNPYVFDAIRADSPENVIFDDADNFDPSFFRDVMWGLARDPSGDGFWVLKASGEVVPYQADFWGAPGYDGLTGIKWHDGNFNGDYKNIVADILRWGGWTFYDPDLLDTEEPGVFGNLESTGIITDTIISSDKFDKKTLIDVIKELAEVVGYEFRIDESGAAIFASPNWWKAGNFDETGIEIYVDETTGERVEEGDVGAIPFIPVLHEEEDLMGYTVTLSSTDKRSEIIIGTDIPDPKDPSRTGYIIHTPPHSLETVAGGVNTMRGIERTAIWISQLFENEQERKLMAELIGLHSWFASRSGNVTVVGNPAISVNDQVRLVERNTSETFIHLVNSIDSNLDNDTGVYTMSIGTHWMGSADNWVIKTEDEPSEYVYTVISDNLNSWQAKTNRGLTGGGGQDESLITASGSFDNSVTEITAIPEMIVLGDSMSYLDSTLNGLTGDRWPNLLEDSGTVVTVKNGAMSGYTTQDLVDDPIVDPESTDALVIFIGANDQNTSLSGVSVNDFSQNLLTLLDSYPAGRQLIVFPWPWTGYPSGETDPAPTEIEYDSYAQAAKEATASRNIRFLHMGDVVDTLMSNTDATNFDDYIVDEIHPSALGHQLLADYIASSLHISYGDVSNWSFSGTFRTVGIINNTRIKVDVMSNLGENVFIEIFSGSDVIFAEQLNAHGQVLTIGTLGNAGMEEYTYTITGTPTNRGMGRLRLAFVGDGTVVSTVDDTIVFLDVDLAEPEEVTTIPEPSDPDFEIVPGADVLFGWSASSTNLISQRIANGYSEPEIWRHFIGDIPQVSTMAVGGGPWSPELPVHLSFKPNISGSVSLWSTALENYLRKGKVAGQVTYVTVWHEPENDLDESWMASASNFRRALNEVTRICRKLTAEGVGKFYSAPVMMTYTLNPSSGRDIEDWLDLSLVDYDIIAWDPYPNDHGYIHAINATVDMDATTHADNIVAAMEYSDSVGKPWSIAEMGTARFHSEMGSLGVSSYTSTDRANYMVEFANFVSGLSSPPVYVCLFTFGECNIDEDPEKTAMNAIIAG
jgi:lysophospholipase L1-like esterase